MGKIYKTTQGKAVDIDTLRLQNEKTIAVGNMKVNARGDQLGPGGQVVQGRNQAMDQRYKLHNPIATEQNSYNAQQNQLRQGASVGAGKAVESIPDVDPSGESFDPPELVQPLPQQMRGSLADSIARKVTVTQDLLDPPNKRNGISRI